MEHYQDSQRYSLGKLYDAVVEKFPSHPAVIHDGITLTYSELRERADALASELSRSFGVNQGDRVGIYLDRSDQLIVAILATVRLGASYVPLDPDYPIERVRYMFQDSNSAVLITQCKHRIKARQLTDAVLDLDSPYLILNGGFTPELLHRAGASSLAYVMYTSGSTGDPKGVAVTHGNIINLISSDYYSDITSSSRMAQLSNSSFDATTFELWGALLNGACLIIIKGTAAYDPNTLPSHLAMHRITHAVLTSAVVSQVAA
ncbi:AMP-binding protein, partial [Pseudomonas cedrina]